MNILLLIIEIISVSAVLSVFAIFFKKEGLFAFAAIMSILANIFVEKQVDYLSFSVSLGAVEFVSLFLVDNLLTECYSKEVAKKSVFLQAASTISYLLLSTIAKSYIPNRMDVVSPAMNIVFSASFRICVMSLLAMIISNYLDIFIFYLSQKISQKHFAIRNMVCSIIASIIDGVVFSFLAFYKNPAVNMCVVDIIEVAIVGTTIKTILIVASTPFVKLIKKFI